MALNNTSHYSPRWLSPASACAWGLSCRTQTSVPCVARWSSLCSVFSGRSWSSFPRLAGSRRAADSGPAGWPHTGRKTRTGLGGWGRCPRLRRAFCWRLPRWGRTGFCSSLVERRLMSGPTRAPWGKGWRLTSGLTRASWRKWPGAWRGRAPWRLHLHTGVIMWFSFFDRTGKCIATLDAKWMHWLLYSTLTCLFVLGYVGDEDICLESKSTKSRVKMPFTSYC